MQYLAQKTRPKNWQTGQAWREALRQFAVRWPDRIDRARTP